MNLKTQTWSLSLSVQPGESKRKQTVPRKGAGQTSRGTGILLKSTGLGRACHAACCKFPGDRDTAGAKVTENGTASVANWRREEAVLWMNSKHDDKQGGPFLSYTKSPVDRPGLQGPFPSPGRVSRKLPMPRWENVFREGVPCCGHELMAGGPGSPGRFAQQCPLVFADCAGCKEEIKHGQSLLALDKQWHVSCFKCQTCSVILTGEYISKWVSLSLPAPASWASASCKACPIGPLAEISSITLLTPSCHT